MTPARSTGVVLALLVGLTFVGCSAAPPPVVLPEAPFLVSYEQKLSWILQLEDQRLLRDPALPDSPPPRDITVSVEPDSEPSTRADVPPGVGPPVVPVVPSDVPDLIRLAQDSSAAVRRRAVVAMGRARLPDAVAPLTAALSDPQMEVRASAAFGLGLLGDVTASQPLASQPLIDALRDVEPVVQARAAQALASLGATDAVDAIQAMVARHVTEAYAVDPEEPDYPLTPRVEAFRSGIYALAALGAYEALAATVLTDEGEPILWWWPVAHALSQVGDARAVGPLSTLAGIQGSVGVAIAAKGLGALRASAALPALFELLDLRRRDTRVVISAVRALGALGDAKAAPALRQLLTTRDLDPTLLLELVEALASVGARESTDVMIELLTHRSPTLRGAALRGLARLDPDLFLLVLSGLPPDPRWEVRADLAEAFASVGPEVAAFRLATLLDDEDRRVVPAVLRSLVAVDAPNVQDLLIAHLTDEDVVVRKTAASLLGDRGDSAAVEPLAALYRAAVVDPSYLARAAAVDSLAKLGGAAAVDVIRQALADPDWAVRVRAADHIDSLDPAADARAAIRPAPSRFPTEMYRNPELIRPSVSPHVFIDTERGTIQLELAVNDAPLTADNFMRLARSGFYNGLLVHRVVPNYLVQAGDPRSDNEGGPGYTIRDELSPLPYLRGTVGMALDWADTGGSQFFITTTPQPQLDGRYPAFGRVIDGMDVVDQLQAGDAIRQVRVWDGTTPQP
ncbi:MAG: HEAT repeat domain-containing protein [Acidobacteria bacterium]|nr:HEAT repeat domain-containing protein [Acidobacteriota bacterium]